MSLSTQRAAEILRRILQVASDETLLFSQQLGNVAPVPHLDTKKRLSGVDNECWARAITTRDVNNLVGASGQPCRPSRIGITIGFVELSVAGPEAELVSHLRFARWTRVKQCRDRNSTPNRPSGEHGNSADLSVANLTWGPATTASDYEGSHHSRGG